MKNILLIIFVFTSLNFCFSQTESNKAYPNAMVGYWTQDYNSDKSQVILTKTTKKKSPIGIQLNANGSGLKFYPRKCGNEPRNINQANYWFVEKASLNITIASVTYKVIKANNNVVILSEI